MIRDYPTCVHVRFNEACKFQVSQDESLQGGDFKFFLKQTARFEMQQYKKAELQCSQLFSCEKHF